MGSHEPDKSKSGLLSTVGEAISKGARWVAHKTVDAYDAVHDRVTDKKFSVRDEEGHLVHEESGKVKKTSERPETSVGRASMPEYDYKVTKEQRREHQYPWDNVDGRSAYNQRVKALNEGDEIDRGVKVLEKMEKRGEKPTPEMLWHLANPETARNQDRNRIAGVIGKKGEYFDDFSEKADLREDPYRETADMYRQRYVNEFTADMIEQNNRARERNGLGDGKSRLPVDPEVAKETPAESRARAEHIVDEDLKPGKWGGLKDMYMEDFVDSYGSKKKYDALRDRYGKELASSETAVDMAIERGKPVEKMDIRKVDPKDIQAALAPMKLAEVKSHGEVSVPEAVSAPAPAPVVAPAAPSATAITKP